MKMTRLFGYVVSPAALLVLLSMAAPVDADWRGRDRELRATLRGIQEVPAVSSGASGRFRGEISKDGSSIDFELSYEGLEGTVTQAHIHVGQRGVNGGISVWLCQTTAPFLDPAGLAATCPQSGTVTGTLTAANVIGPAGQGIDAGQFAELIRAMREGVTYANVHSSDPIPGSSPPATRFGGGEIRGQIKARGHDDDD
jgi:hypothetical protein